MDLPAIRAAIKRTLDDAVGDSVQTTAYWISNPTPPSLVLMGQDEVEYGTGGQGREDAEVAWVLLAFSGIAEEVAAQDELDRWMASSGERSIRAILEARDDDGAYLGGLVPEVYDVTVERATGNQLYDLPNIEGSVLGTQFTVRVRTSE